MKSLRTMLLGIAIIMFGIAVSTWNFFGWSAGGLGMAIVVYGVYTGEKEK